MNMQKLDKVAFREAMIDHMGRHGIGPTELSRATGVSKTQLDKLHQRKTKATNVMDALCIAHHFGKSIEGLLETMPPKGKAAEIDEIYGSLAPADQYVAISLLRALSAKREKQARSEVDQTKRPS